MGFLPRFLAKRLTSREDTYATDSPRSSPPNRANTRRYPSYPRATNSTSREDLSVGLDAAPRTDTIAWSPRYLAPSPDDIEPEEFIYNSFTVVRRESTTSTIHLPHVNGKLSSRQSTWDSRADTVMDSSRRPSKFSCNREECSIGLDAAANQTKQAKPTEGISSRRKSRFVVDPEDVVFAWHTVPNPVPVPPEPRSSFRPEGKKFSRRDPEARAWCLLASPPIEEPDATSTGEIFDSDHLINDNQPKAIIRRGRYDTLWFCKDPDSLDLKDSTEMTRDEFDAVFEFCDVMKHKPPVVKSAPAHWNKWKGLWPWSRWVGRCAKKLLPSK